MYVIAAGRNALGCRRHRWKNSLSRVGRWRSPSSWAVTFTPRDAGAAGIEKRAEEMRVLRNWIVLATEKADCQEKNSEKSGTQRGRFHVFLRSLTRGSLKVGLAMERNRAGCRLRRSPGLAAVPARWLVRRGRCAAFPWRCPFLLRDLEEIANMSDAPQWPAQYRIPPYSRASATAFLVARWYRTLAQVQPLKAHRLPVHEVRGDCEGRDARCSGYVPQLSRSVGVNEEPAATFQAACSHADGRMNRAPRRAASEKPVRAIRAGRRWRAVRREDICRSGEARPGRRIRAARFSS